MFFKLIAAKSQQSKTYCEKNSISPPKMGKTEQNHSYFNSSLLGQVFSQVMIHFYDPIQFLISSFFAAEPG
jgi:hypothetical protein